MHGTKVMISSKKRHLGAMACKTSQVAWITSWLMSCSSIESMLVKIYSATVCTNPVKSTHALDNKSDTNHQMNDL